MACKRELTSVPYHDSIRVGDARLTYTPFMWTVYCQCAVELTRAAAISVIYRMVGGGDFFRPVTVMWRFCTNNKVSQGAAGDFF